MMGFTSNILIVSLYITLSVFRSVLPQHAGITREYCMETFNPHCGTNEVIWMKKALYGRMKKGRCMKDDYGMASCYNDELEFFDDSCSGRQKCDVDIPNIGLTTKLTCIKELRPYLDAGYKCQRVYVPSKGRCIAPEHVTVTKRPVYLASNVSLKTSCGLHDSPWILDAKKGQTIHINLIDFNWKNTSHPAHGRTSCRVKYGYILDMESDDVTSICGGDSREKHVYQSIGHSVQVVLEGATLHSKHFIISFKALGCPEYDIPPYAWTQKDNETLVVKCEHSADQWSLRCIDDIWLGIPGSCPPPPTTIKSAVAIPKVASSKIKAKQDGGLPDISHNHVFAFAMMCITLIICCTVIVLGFHCSKRYELNAMKQTYSTQPMTKSAQVQNGTVRSSIIFKPIREQRDWLPAGTMELPPYAFPVAKENRTPKPPQRTASYRDNNMVTSMTDSDYLAPQNEAVGDENEVQYYILENPAESMGNMSEEMYQSIHLHNSLQSNKT